MFKHYRENILSVVLEASLAIVIFMQVLGPTAALAANNTAANVAGGSNALSPPPGVGVTVNPATLQLVKQVWVNGACMASSDTSGGADSCGSPSTNTVVVPSGTTVQFLIYVRNTSDIALTDIRFHDILDTTASGFTYVAASLKRTALAASAPTDVDTAANIRTNASNVMSDTAGNDEASSVGGTINTGQPTDAIVAVNAHRTYGIMFNVTKN